MSTDTATGEPIEPKGLKASLYRSLLTQYWQFTVYVLMYAVVGIALGSAAGAFDLITAACLLAGLWFGLEGLHAIDLADDGVAVDLDPNVQTVVGYVQVVIGSLFGIVVAIRSTWAFLILVPVAAISGLAYNEEWFGGLFHDRDKATGLANFGLSWGFIPALAGFVAIGETYALGAVIFAIGAGVDAAVLNYHVGPSKMERYRDMGIHTTRDYEPDPDVMEKRLHHGQKMRMVAWVCIALGTTVLLVP